MADFSVSGLTVRRVGLAPVGYRWVYTDYETGDRFAGSGAQGSIKCAGKRLVIAPMRIRVGHTQHDPS